MTNYYRVILGKASAYVDPVEHWWVSFYRETYPHSGDPYPSDEDIDAMIDERQITPEIPERQNIPGPGYIDAGPDQLPAGFGFLQQPPDADK